MVGRRFRSHPGARDWPGDACARASRLESGSTVSRSPPGRDTRRPMRRERRGVRTSRYDAARRVMQPTCGSRSSITPPVETATRVPRRLRSSRGSSSSTFRGMAGMTSATTFWSIASARSTRGGSAASIGTSSGRMRSASTPARSASRSSGLRGRIAVVGRARRDRSPHRVAARPRARRSHVVPHLRLGRQRSLSDRRSGASERGLGRSRHRVHGMSRRCPLRETRRDRLERPSFRGPEDLRAESDRDGNCGPCPRTTLATAELGRSPSRAAPARSSLAARGRERSSTGRGTRRVGRPGRIAGRSPPRPHDLLRGSPALAAARCLWRSRASSPSLRRSARTATDRLTRRPSATASALQRTSPSRSSTRSAARSRLPSIACGRPPASTRSRSTARCYPTAATASSSRPERPPESPCRA